MIMGIQGEGGEEGATVHSAGQFAFGTSDSF